MWVETCARRKEWNRHVVRCKGCKVIEQIEHSTNLRRQLINGQADGESEAKGQEVKPPPALSISQNDARAALYRRRIREWQKDKDPVKSIELWLQAIREKGGRTLFERNRRQQVDGSFLVAWCTSFQLEVSYAKNNRHAWILWLLTFR